MATRRCTRQRFAAAGHRRCYRPLFVRSGVHTSNGREQQIGGDALDLVIRVVRPKIEVIDIGEACHKGRAHFFRPPRRLLDLA